MYEGSDKYYKMRDFIYELENEYLKIGINLVGAEISGITSKSDGYSYLWSGDAKHWAGRAPILFPIIGNLNEGTYLYKGKEYKMERHGFASKMYFQIVESRQRSLKLTLTHNDLTLPVYPFKFRLTVAYSLEKRNIATTFQVENTGDEVMWFSIGGHPGFNCSVGPVGRKKGLLIFEKPETVNRIVNENGFLTGEEEPFLCNSNIIDIGSLSFSGDKKVYIFKGLKSEEITLVNEEAQKMVTVRFRGFPYLGLWSPANEAPFICIEPLHGITGTLGYKEVLEKKRGIMNIKPEESFNCSFEIICN